MAESSIYPTERAHFTNRLRQINQAYDLGVEQNNYEKQLAGKEYGWSRADLVRRLGQQRAQLPGAYTRRGLSNSGIQQRGLIDFRTQANDSQARLTDANNLKNFGFWMTGDQLARVRDESKAALARQQEALREQRAASLRSVM
jgi:hypothetical protein